MPTLIPDNIIQTPTESCGNYVNFNSLEVFLRISGMKMEFSENQKGIIKDIKFKGTLEVFECTLKILNKLRDWVRD